MDSDEQITELVRWGLPLDEIKHLGQRLRRFYDRFRSCARTKTQDTSEYGLCYMSGLLRMGARRTMASIGVILDESADEKAGNHSAGAARQTMDGRTK